MSQQPLPHREFAYTPRWGVMIGGAALFGIAGVVLQAIAASNERGVSIGGLIKLSAAHATTFYWVLSWLSFGFVVLAAVMLVVRLVNPQKLVLAAEGLYAPRWAWSRTPSFIAYRDVRDVSLFAVSGQEFLKIVHAGGKQNVTASMLESQYAFEDFCREFSLRLQAIERPAAA